MKTCISTTQFIEGDVSNMIINMSARVKVGAGIEFTSADRYIDDDGNDLKIGVSINNDIIFLNGATEVAKINEVGVTDLIS